MRRCTPAPGSRQRGRSLVELMVGMVIGLIILAALGYLFLGIRQASRTHDDISRMQESGRHALEILGIAIRQAGYRANVDVEFSGAALAGTNGTGDAPDSLTVQFDAQEGSEADCAGTKVDAGALVTYAFAVNGALQLTCNGQPVADNIENMQIEYGVDVDKDGVIDAYTATPADFGKVAAVRVTLTVRGPTPNAATNAATGDDGFLRQTYTSTFTVRNQAW